MVLADNPLTIHQQLRCSTHGAHVRLNRHPLLGQLTRPALDILVYTHLLHLYLDFYRAIETVIHDYFAEGVEDFDYGERYKTDWLVQDLHHLGEVPADTRYRSPALVFKKPKNKAELVGLLYPLEGSTLGGQLISRRLQENLGLAAGTGGRFFYGYGEDTAGRWAEFLDFAGRSVNSPGGIDQACAVARGVFNMLEEHLDGSR